MREQNVKAAPALILSKSASVGERQVCYELYRCNESLRITLRDGTGAWSEYEKSEEEARALLELLHKHTVTPCTFADIMRDLRFERMK